MSTYILFSSDNGLAREIYSSSLPPEPRAGINIVQVSGTPIYDASIQTLRIVDGTITVISAEEAETLMNT